MKDAILALNILTGTDTNDSINLDEDVNGDRKVGLEEVVHILHVVAGR